MDDDNKTEAGGYRAPPITEALVELRFQGSRPWDTQLLAAMHTRFVAEYGGASRQTGQLQLAAHLAGDAVLTHGQMNMDMVLLPTADGRAVVGLGADRLSVHVVEPYPGWTSFRPRIAAALEAWREVAAPTGVLAVSVRYIDRIGIPTDGAPLHDYFPLLPRRAKSSPPRVQAFHVVTQSHDPAEDYSAVLTMATAPPEADRLVMLYDLNVLRLREAPGLALDAVMDHVDFLHDRQKLIFEDSITDKTRGLFQ